MRLSQASLWLSTLLVFGGCGGDDPSETPQLSEVTVTCTPSSVVAGQSAECTASAKDQDGQPFSVSSYAWTSTVSSVATVNTKGQVTTVTAGSTAIQASATASGVTRQGQATLTVTQVPEPLPTVHASNITSNETWLAANNPHLVRGQIALTGTPAPTLTLEKGVVIRFEADAELRVLQGAILAQGTQDAGIRMVLDPGAAGVKWRGLVFAHKDSVSQLEHVALSECGGASGAGGCIVIQDQAAPVLRDVTVQRSGTSGVLVAQDGSGFGASSARLNVSDSQGYAVRMGSNQADTLPTGGTFSGNQPNAIELRGNVARSQTWRHLGIPYDVPAQVDVSGTPTPTLTLSAGVVLRFGRASALAIGENGLGELVVDGTAAAPILFTADAAAPQPGHWYGVHLQPRTSSSTRLSHVTIEYAGAERPAGRAGRGNLNIYGNSAGGGARPILNNVIVQKSSHYGVFLQEDGAFGPGSALLTSRDNGGYAIALEGNFVGSIPQGGVFSGNAINAVEILYGGVRETQTWSNLGIPYVLNETLEVGSANSPKLTLTPGTELRFALDKALIVGQTRPGTLSAEGTATAPIRFVPNTETPARGHWRGLYFWQAEGSRLDYTVVTHGGALGNPGRGNVNIFRELGAFLTNSVLNDSLNCAVTRSGGGHTGSTPVTTDYTLSTYGNSFSGNESRQCAN
ncbi:hypothetical protein POL68_34240 [Stigmatella sp. ncwal1]|uniref:Ig-like domain (Group 2) n=1 Tax=Stigmatella ashevillensis TaxID=2995309 RepID=A0ABT5DIT5_9BACT|nr:hypothetical protein [Stigmatella ashevillena]MDC0713576.1 hypothetical protein [Stigmatella ashevillena]